MLFLQKKTKTEKNNKTNIRKQTTNKTTPKQQILIFVYTSATNS